MASYDIEKEDPKIDYLERSATEETNDARVNRFSPAEQRKIIRRVDRRLVLTLGFMYCVSLMDRTNLGIAVVGGMGVDLLLTGPRYSIIVLVFFITYVILQVIVPKAFPQANFDHHDSPRRPLSCERLAHAYSFQPSLYFGAPRWSASRSLKSGVPSFPFASFSESSKPASFPVVLIS